MNNFLSLLLAVAFFPGQPGLQRPPASAARSQAAPAVKSPPQAKTHAEYQDYNTAYATTGGAAMEKAADDFAARYPASELRPYLYAKAMHEYLNENQPAKTLAMGEKVLALDPDNTVALVLTATVLSDQLSDTGADRQQKISEIKKNATRALDTINVAYVPPANATAEQVAAYKSSVESMAHSALGIMNLKLGAYSESEKELQAAADLGKAQPDPYVWYHLALSQDHQNKYAAALSSVNQALRYTGSGSGLETLAQGERDRLVKLAAAGPPQAKITRSHRPK